MTLFSRAAATLALSLVFASSCNPAVNSGGNGSGSAGSGGSSGSGAGGAGGKPGPDFNFPDGGTAAQDAVVAPDAIVSVGGVTRPCVNLECQQTICQMGPCKQTACTGGAKTTLRGRVYDPAGRVPLYNVVVYVPNAALDPIPTGPGCDRCDSPVSGKPVVSALTDTKGEFVLENVPAGTAIPVVVQIGRWRRQVSIPQVTACSETKVDDPNLLRLPRNQSEGHLPKIALATGARDRLECLLRKMGVDDAEFTPEAGTGRVNLFGGRGGTAKYAPALNGGAPFTPATTFWGDAARYKQYDMVVLSCEGNQYEQDKAPAARQALFDFANMGGRVFASHWHNVWLEKGPAPWPQVATFGRHPDLADPFTAEVDTSFPKGDALASWLLNVSASSTRGRISIAEAQHTVESVNAMYSRRWIHSNATMPTSVQYFTFNCPAGAEAGKECGRVVFTDIHVSAGDKAGVPFPSGCITQELSPQEKALEFMLFDLSSCIQPETQIPRPPVIN